MAALGPMVLRQVQAAYETCSEMTPHDLSARRPVSFAAVQITVTAYHTLWSYTLGMRNSWTPLIECSCVHSPTCVGTADSSAGGACASAVMLRWSRIGASVTSDHIEPGPSLHTAYSCTHLHGVPPCHASRPPLCAPSRHPWSLPTRQGRQEAGGSRRVLRVDAHVIVRQVAAPRLS